MSTVHIDNSLSFGPGMACRPITSYPLRFDLKQKLNCQMQTAAMTDSPQTNIVLFSSDRAMTLDHRNKIKISDRELNLKFPPQLCRKNRVHLFFKLHETK